MASGAMTGKGAAASPARSVARVLSLPIRHATAEAIAVVMLCPILLSTAIWNGFPIIYYDTGAYILQGIGLAFIVERSPVYSVFLPVAGATLSLWLVVGIQALMTAFVMTEAARVVTPRMRLWALMILGAVLCIITALPWYVGQVEPDCLTALAIVSAYLIAFHAKILGFARTAALAAICTFSTAAHPSHLALTAGLALALAAYRGIVWTARKKSWPVADPIPVALSVTLALVLIVGCNFGYTGQIFVTRAGPAFIFARLLQDRIVMRLLDDTCPQSGYRLCAYKDVLPRRADGWLWGRDSPFDKLGRFAGTDDESRRIIAASLARYPWLNVKAALKDAAVQFFTYSTGDQIEPQEWALKGVFVRYIPHQVPAYMNARQQQGEIRFHDVNLLQVPVAGISLAGLAAVLVYAVRRRRRKSVVLLGYVLVALLGNAFICGALSNPHARYQSRIMWIVPFALALTAVDWRIAALRGMSESGT